VTRPDPAGSALCQYLQDQGDVAIHFPTIAFAPPRDLSALTGAIDQLGQQDWLIFISPQAVYHAIPLIRQRWPQFSSRVQFAAVGAGTAAALKEAGYIAAALPKEEWSSDGILELVPFQQAAGKNIAIIRGEGGRERLEGVLAERGATVLSVMAYQRIVPKMDISPYLILFKENKIDVIVCTSFQGVQNLKAMVGAADWVNLSHVPLIVVSDRIKLLASDLGFQRIWVAANASHQAISAIIAQKRTELCQQQRKP
jgi:uroporphyrinogen-III synthase